MAFRFNTTAVRSRNMSAIRAKHGKTTEWRLRAALVAKGVRGWTMNVAALPGCPDFYFCQSALAIFVDGCFWHGCPKCGHTPSSNRGYWTEKLARNKERDRKNGRRLRQQGIRVVRFWECQLRQRLAACLKTLAMALETSGREPPK